MLRTLLAAVGLASATAAGATPPYAAYASDAANGIYNMLFCDEPAFFRPAPDEPAVTWKQLLASTPADVPALRSLAGDPATDGRIRYLAYQRLRHAGVGVPSRQILGVIVEMALPTGLDTLAAYADGSIRYVNHSGKMALIDAALPFAPLVRALLTASQPAVDATGPWRGVRRPPPAQGGVRLSFLVSDGLYFGEGPIADMQRDPYAAPVLGHATQLLQAVAAAMPN